MRIFSLFSLVLVICLIVWWAVRDMSQDVGLVAPEHTGSLVETPIEQAQHAKQLIESRNLGQD